MWFSVTCILCFAVAVYADPQNVDTLNVTKLREKRYGYYYHPNSGYTFPTSPPRTDNVPYYNDHYPQPDNESLLPQYGNLNNPPQPDSNTYPYIPSELSHNKQYSSSGSYDDSNPYTPPRLSYDNEYSPPDSQSPLPSYNINLPPPAYGDPNHDKQQRLPYNNDFWSVGNQSHLPPYGNPNFTLPNYDHSNSYTPPKLSYNNQHTPPSDRILSPPHSNLNRPSLNYDRSNPYTPRLPYNDQYQSLGTQRILPSDSLNPTLPNNGGSNNTRPFDWNSQQPDRQSPPFISSDDEEDPCNPHFSEKPDFLAGGRRISEAKCLDYEWTLKRKQEIEQKRISCEIETKRKQTGFYEAVPAAVGGRAAFPGEFPHMGAIGWLGLNGEWLFKCGSSLISSKFVLTAAHCSRASDLSTDLADPVPKIVRLSHVDIDLATRDEVALKDDINIKRIIVHPNYKPPKKYYDIALMELDHEVGFSQMVQPACLWTSPSIRQLSAIATLTGWGVLKEGSLNFSPILQAAVVDFIGKQRCDSLLAKKRNRHWSGLQDHQICAGKLAGGVDACQGDSGGPLQVPKKLEITTVYKMYYVVGVTAFGFGCARQNLPGVYTRVSSFIDWIEPIVWL